MMPLIDVPMQAWTEIEDPARSTLVNGGFETVGGSPPPSWSQLQTVATSVAGTRPGGLGSFVCQCDWDTINASGLIYQNALTVGSKARCSGRVELTGAISFSLQAGLTLGTVWAGPRAWSQFNDTLTVSTDGLLRLNLGGQAAGRLAKFDDIATIPLVVRTPNLGSKGGYLDMGDGLAPATQPTRAPNTTSGFAFNGSQYLQWMSPITQGTFTYCALVMRTGAATQYLLDARAGGGAGRVWWDGANLASGDGTMYVDGVASTVLPYGQVSLVTCAGMTISAPTKLVLQATNALATPWTGNVLGQVLLPGTLTPRQMRDWKYRLMARAWT